MKKTSQLFWGKRTFFERKLLAWGFDVLFVPTLTDLGNLEFLVGGKTPELTILD